MPPRKRRVEVVPSGPARQTLAQGRQPRQGLSRGWLQPAGASSSHSQGPPTQPISSSEHAAAEPPHSLPTAPETHLGQSVRAGRAAARQRAASAWDAVQPQLQFNRVCAEK